VDDLLRFARIVEAGTFAEAARRAGTTTSAVSKSVSRIELAYGVRLLHRTTHGLSLTSDGEQILDEVHALLRQVECLDSSLAALGTQGMSGGVTISAPSAFARACLVPLLPRLLEENPDLSIELSLQDAFADLAADGVDIAIRSGPVQGLPGHLVRRLGSFPWILCASPAYLRLHGTPATPAELSGHEQIAFRNPASGRVLPWRFRDPGSIDGSGVQRFTPSGRLVFDDGDVGWAMVRAGVGISWAPTWLGIEDIRNGSVVEIMADRRVEETSLSAVRLGQRTAPPRVKTVLDFLSRAAPFWGVAHPAP